MWSTAPATEQDYVAPAMVIAVAGRRPENLDARPRQPGSSAAGARRIHTGSRAAQAGMLLGHIARASRRGYGLRRGGRRAINERRQRLPCFDDVGGEHVACLRANVQRVVRCAGWHQERVASVQGEGRLPLDHHLHCPREDVPDFFTWMDVPAGLDTALEISVST